MAKGRRGGRGRGRGKWNYYLELERNILEFLYRNRISKLLTSGLANLTAHRLDTAIMNKTILIKNHAKVSKIAIL